LVTESPNCTIMFGSDMETCAGIPCTWQVRIFAAVPADRLVET